MKTLFHLHRETSSQNIELESQIKNISPGSIYFKESVEKLIIPEGVRELKADAIHGNIREVIFLGQLNHIEKGALQNIYRRNGDCTIKINGLLSDLDNEGLNVIKEWTEKHYTHNVIFVAPKPCGRGLIGNGFIELSEVISSKVKLALGADTRPISINADINKGVVIQDGNETEINNVPIIINRTKTSEKDTFSPVDVTKIRFAKNEISFCVHEDYEMVEKLIRQSYNGIN